MQKKTSRKLYYSLPKNDQSKLEEYNKNMLISKVMIFFKIMKFRMKISY